MATPVPPPPPIPICPFPSLPLSLRSTTSSSSTTASGSSPRGTRTCRRPMRARRRGRRRSRGCTPTASICTWSTCWWCPSCARSATRSGCGGCSAALGCRGTPQATCGPTTPGTQLARPLLRDPRAAAATGLIALCVCGGCFSFPQGLRLSGDCRGTRRLPVTRSPSSCSLRWAIIATRRQRPFLSQSMLCE